MCAHCRSLSCFKCCFYVLFLSLSSCSFFFPLYSYYNWLYLVYLAAIKRSVVNETSSVIILLAIEKTGSCLHTSVKMNSLILEPVKSESGAGEEKQTFKVSGQTEGCWSPLMLLQFNVNIWQGGNLFIMEAFVCFSCDFTWCCKRQHNRSKWSLKYTFLLQTWGCTDDFQAWDALLSSISGLHFCLRSLVFTLYTLHPRLMILLYILSKYPKIAPI